MDSISQAIVFATTAHEGQKDRQGVPYIFHPLRVMLSLKNESVDTQIVAVLHDIKEDCPVFWNDLVRVNRFWFTPSIRAVVEAVSRIDNEDWWPYIKRIMSDPTAVKVKLADLHDNMRPLGKPREKDYKRYAKYMHTIDVLSGKIAFPV